MGDIADMMIEGLLDEETGEYIGDINQKRYGQKAPGFPISYERERREAVELKTKCPHCDRKVKKVGLNDHIRDKHSIN